MSSAGNTQTTAVPAILPTEVPNVSSSLTSGELHEENINYGAIAGAVIILFAALLIIGIVMYIMQRRKRLLEEGNSRAKRQTVAHMSYLERSPQAPSADSGSGRSSPAWSPLQNAMNRNSEYRPPSMMAYSDIRDYNFRNSSFAMSSPSLHTSQFDPRASPPPARNRISTFNTQNTPYLPSQEPTPETVTPMSPIPFPPHAGVNIPRHRQRTFTMDQPVSNMSPTVASKQIPFAEPTRNNSGETSLVINPPSKVAHLHPLRRTLPPIPATSPFYEGAFSK